MKEGLVVKTTGSWHTVKSEQKRYNCRLKGNFRTGNMKNTNPIAVGDHVLFEFSDNETGVITKIENRKNYIIRKSTNLSRESQIIAANIDQVILLFTLDFPKTPLEFIDRFLLSSEAYHIKTILVINKTDLYEKEKLKWMQEVFRTYKFAEYEIFDISVTHNKNLDMVEQIINKKITLISGNSGVGKSSLINSLCPGLKLKTNDISWYHEAGKHTTTYPEMIEIDDNNTFLIDSPGIRGFGITDIQKNEIGLYFTDIFKLSRDCQFYNCSHIHEPNCAVIEAYRNGILHESRYRSYYNIFHDTDMKYRIG